MVFAAARSVVAGRKEALEAGIRTSLNLARTLGTTLEGTLRQVDLVLLAAEDHVQLHGASGASPQLEAELARLTARLPILDAVRTANAAGIVEHGVDVKPGSAIDISDRDYFARARESRDLVTSAAITSRVNGKQVVMLARRIAGVDGAFAGVVYGAVPIDQLTAALARVEVGWRGALALRDRDLAVVARFPPRPKGAGGAVVSQPVSPEFGAVLASGREEASFVAPSQVDGLDKLVAYRRVGADAFHLIVSADLQEVLSDWREAATQTLAAAASFIALTLLGAFLLLRAWDREEEERVASRVAAEQADLIRELQTALAEVKTLSGLLPICAHCKKIRDDDGSWNRLEVFIRERSEAEFTHGICPDCLEHHFPEPPDASTGG